MKIMNRALGSPGRGSLGTAAMAGILILSGPASAERIWFDDFNSEAGGETAIFQQTLTNWDIIGNIDIIAPDNQLGYTVDSTVIDLGGGLTGGFMRSKETFRYDAGKLVTISWDLGGNQIRPENPDAPYVQFFFEETHPERYQDLKFIRGTELFEFATFEPWEGCNCDSVRVFDELFFLTYLLDGDYPITRQSISFLPVRDGAFQFLLGTFSGGGFGPLIDNFAVDVTDYSASPTVPEPATWAMLVAGFGMIGTAARRRRRMTSSI